jgi:hypothetical protein
MPGKPGFTDVQIVGDKVIVVGESDADVSDVVDIRVTLVQGKRMAAAPVTQIGSSWKVELPVSDPAGDFHAGEAVAFGVETRSENLLTMTWTEPVTIR